MHAESGINKKYPSTDEIQNWLVSYLAKTIEVSPDEVDVKVPFEEYGLDSSMSVNLVSELEAWLEDTLDPTLVYGYPTIETLARHVSSV
jgi:acyl carrier protein